jgi:lycopene beta-cyclase
MARGRRDGVLIAGGGLAGCLAALAMARLRPDVPLLIVEEDERFGSDGLWTFFEADLPKGARDLVAPLIAHSWPGYYAAFPGRSRKIKAPLHAVSGERIDAAMRAALKPVQYRLRTKVVAVREDALVLQGGEKIRAEGAIDARGAANLAMLEPGWRKFLSREYALEAPHGLDRPVLADATVEQWEGYRSVETLPLAPDRLVATDTVLDAAPDLDPETASGRLNGYVAKRGWQPSGFGRERSGALPVPTGGDFQAFWRIGGARVAKIGMRGGFFHPLTGGTLADGAAAALLLAAQRDLSGAALHEAFGAEAMRLWKAREPYRAFNARLMAAGSEEKRARLARLYGLEAGLLGRFLGDRMGWLDRIRVQAAVKG